MFIGYLNIRNTKHIMAIWAIVAILNNLLLYYNMYDCGKEYNSY